MKKQAFSLPRLAKTIPAILAFAAVGTAVLLASHAATPAVPNALEPENGVVSGGAIATAAAGTTPGYVTFAAPVSSGNSLTVDAAQTVAPFDRRIKGLGMANWTFTAPSFNKPLIGQVQGLGQAVKALDPGLIRYAGGLWANFVGFDRTKAAQVVPQTAWTKNGQTYYYSYGTDELKSLDSFAKSVNADVMIQVNISNNDPAMWADLAAYAKENNLTSIKYYEFGNELDFESQKGSGDAIDPATYGTRLAAYQKAILAADPTVNMVGGVASTASDIMYKNYASGGNTPSEYVTQAIAATHGAGKDLNSASFHWYQQSGTITLADVLTWSFNLTSSSTDWWRQAYSRSWSEGVGPWLRSTALASSPTTQLGVSELGVNSSDNITFNGNYAAALWYSDVLGRLAYNGVNWVTQWDSYASQAEYFSLFYPSSDTSTSPTLNLRPTYYAYAMYSKYFGDQMVNSKTYDPTQLSIWASTDTKDPGKLKLRITNLTASAITSPITLSNFSPKSAAAYVMTSTNPTDSSVAGTTAGTTVKINGSTINAASVDASMAAIAGQAVAVNGNSLQTTFPAYSSTAIIVTPN